MPSVHGRKKLKLVVLNENNQPIGPTHDVVAELGSFLGTLARNAAFCPLNMFNWRKLETKKICENISRKNMTFLMLQKAYKNDELQIENRPVDVAESQFRDLLNYWNSDAYKKMSQTNTENCKELKYPHTAGKKVLLEYARKKRKKLLSLYQARTSLWLHEKENPIEYTRPRMRILLLKLLKWKKIQSTQESEVGSQSVDAFTYVMGPEHPGRLRLYGHGVTKASLKRKVGDFGTSSYTYEVMEQKLEEIEERME